MLVQKYNYCCSGGDTLVIKLSIVLRYVKLDTVPSAMSSAMLYTLSKFIISCLRYRCL